MSLDPQHERFVHFQRLVDRPDGILFLEPTDDLLVLVIKLENQLRLIFMDPEQRLALLAQSRLDLSSPLDLPSCYTQALLLTLAWKTPESVYMIGLGGGRVPAVLQHYFPHIHTTCTEIEPLVLRAATQWFGLLLNDRLRVEIQDGRVYLENQQAVYDVILIDAFDSDSVPKHLSTVEFFQLCRVRLSSGGVLAINLLEMMPRWLDWVKTVQHVFAHTCLWHIPGENAVIYAWEGDSLAPTELQRRIKVLQSQYDFAFSLPDCAVQVVGEDALSRVFSELAQAQVLHDQE